MKNYVEIRAIEKKPDITEQAMIFITWLVVGLGLLIASLIFLSGLEVIFS